MFEASDVWHLIPKDAKLWKVERGGILQEDNSKEGDSKLFERISILMRKLSTGKSFSEVLIIASTNPQHGKRLSIELPVQYMKIPSSEHCQKMLCTQIVLNVKTKTKKKQFIYTTCSELVVFMYWTGKSMNNLLSFCWLVDPRISASDKDLPVK